MDPDGVDDEKLAFVLDLKNRKRGRIREYADKYSSAQYHEGRGVWNVEADVALPCATQNELNAHDAANLVENGVKLVAEGANMPTTAEKAANRIVSSNVTGMNAGQLKSGLPPIRTG